MLGDIDRQQSAREWLKLRPQGLPPIRSWDIAPGEPARPPKDTTHVVLDTPAGLHGKKTRRGGEEHPPRHRAAAALDLRHPRHARLPRPLLEEKAVRNQKTFIAVVGMRVDARTRAAHELERFLEGLDVPVLGFLRDTQVYVQAAAHGLTLFDLVACRLKR
jgi:chromosome partitioning protein